MIDITPITPQRWTCPKCGFSFAPFDNRRYGHEEKCNGKIGGGGSYNEYGEGYEQGQEDARNGLDADPSGYGGNGQFEKGYEDGYEDY